LRGFSSYGKRAKQPTKIFNSLEIGKRVQPTATKFRTVSSAERIEEAQKSGRGTAARAAAGFLTPRWNTESEEPTAEPPPENSGVIFYVPDEAAQPERRTEERYYSRQRYAAPHRLISRPCGGEKWQRQKQGFLAPKTKRPGLPGLFLSVDQNVGNLKNLAVYPILCPLEPAPRSDCPQTPVNVRRCFQRRDPGSEVAIEYIGSAFQIASISPYSSRSIRMFLNRAGQRGDSINT
jgi:hypothetical protein